jgi:predicted nucleotidyltransferase
MLGATGLISGDWDGDGDLDLAVANFTANTVVSLGNDGTGSFAIDDTVLNQIGASALATGDWNSDGDLDLAVANSTGGNNVRTLENL